MTSLAKSSDTPCRICAVLAVRNEERTLQRCIRHLVEQGLVVAVIDNESTDGTSAILDRLPPEILVHRGIHPFRGFYDWRGLLSAKQRFASTFPADWFMHADTDEIPEAPSPFKTLAEGVQEADRLGFNTINFDEFVFVPDQEDQPAVLYDYVAAQRYYYFFSPSEKRLLRLWKRSPDIDLATSGGHRVSLPGQRIFPKNFVLRHYIARSRRELPGKYRDRVYAADELALGWHGNRHGIGLRPIRFPAVSELHEYKEDGVWDTSKPWRWHFFDTRIEQSG